MSRFIPQPAYPDAMPVDISFVFEDERPAGKHGFLKADGDDFRFEDGTLGRFWGVNFNGGACFPDKDYAKKVARRLAQAGCNIVRFHQLDAEFDTPNIYAYTKGKRVTTTRVLDERSMDALDYIIYALKEEGIYTYLDMSTYRHYKEGDGVVDCEYLIDNGRPWSNIDPRMIELQKEFVHQIWERFNPYTGCKYCDEPAIVMSEIVNENDLFTNSNGKRADNVVPQFYKDEFRNMFKAWLDGQGKTYDWETYDMYNTDDDMVNFKVYATAKYYQEMYDEMRAAGCKCCITGTNWTHSSGLIKAHQNMDFTDSHHYFYDWKWGNTERVCAHKAITESPVCVFPNLAAAKIAGKPFFVSEWDMPWPNSFRAEGPIYYAAVGALQGWGGFAIHTYSYGTRLEDMKILGKEQSSPVGGVPYREGIFSVWNDPAKFGLFYHAALITRRQDITPATEKVAVDIKTLGKTSSAAFKTLEEQHLAGTVYDGKLPAGYDRLVGEEHTEANAVPGRIESDNGQMWRDLKKKIGAIDTPRTKVLYGALSAGPTSSIKTSAYSGIELTDLVVEAKVDFGVIALSSLTDAPINSSDNMLLSTIGRARNDGAQFDGNKMIERGHEPIMAEVIPATIRIKTPLGQKLKVHGVNAEGFYAGRMATTYEDGWLSFNVGDEMNPACYYLIVAD